MKRIPSIKSVMTAFPYWIDINETLVAAENMMTEHEISHLPVKEDGKLVALVARHDIDLARIAGGDNVQYVKDVCVLDVYKVDMEEPLDNVVSHMANHHIGSALIMKDERLAGVFTVHDACHYLVEHLRYQFRPDTGNDIA
jgi:predicted transcriptional regulator